MGTISVHEIETNPAAFLARVAAGERLRIEDNGRTVAEVQPGLPAPSPNKVPGKRSRGLAAVQFVVPDDFNDPMELVPAPVSPLGETPGARPDPYQPTAETPTQRPFGLAKGKIVVPDDFNDPMELVPVSPPPPKKKGRRPRGLAEGMFVVPDDFNDPLPEEILRDFEGRDR